MRYVAEIEVEFEGEKHCQNGCPLMNHEDACILQDDDFDTWEAQMKNCPLVLKVISQFTPQPRYIINKATLVLQQSYDKFSEAEQRVIDSMAEEMKRIFKEGEATTQDA